MKATGYSLCSQYTRNVDCGQIVKLMPETCEGKVKDRYFGRRRTCRKKERTIGLQSFPRSINADPIKEKEERLLSCL